MALLKTEPKIQSDVDAGAVREMQPTEQIAIKINGHISNILSRPGQNFSITDKAGLLRPYIPYFIRHAFQLPKYLVILIVLWFGTHLWDALEDDRFVFCNKRSVHFSRFAFKVVLLVVMFRVFKG